MGKRDVRNSILVTSVVLIIVLLGLSYIFLGKGIHFAGEDVPGSGSGDGRCAKDGMEKCGTDCCSNNDGRYCKHYQKNYACCAKDEEVKSYMLGGKRYYYCSKTKNSCIEKDSTRPVKCGEECCKQKPEEECVIQTNSLGVPVYFACVPSDCSNLCPADAKKGNEKDCCKPTPEEKCVNLRGADRCIADECEKDDEEKCSSKYSENGQTIDICCPKGKCQHQPQSGDPYCGY